MSVKFNPFTGQLDIVGAADSNVVHKTGAESITGSKSFDATNSSSIHVANNGATGTDVSAAAALHVDNTDNTGIGLGVYTDSASALAPLMTVKSANAAFNRYTSYIESNTTQLTADTLRVAALGGARGIFIQQTKDAGSIIIDASAAPNSISGTNQTVMAIQGNNDAYSMVKFVNQADSITNNANVLIENTGTATLASGLTVHQYGQGNAIRVEVHDSTTAPAIAVDESVYGMNIISSDYGVRLEGGTGLVFDGDNTGTVSVERTTGTTSGARLDVISGSAQAGQTNKNGGELRLKSGIATGNGTSDITLTTNLGAASGTSDGTHREVMRVFGSGNANGRVAIGTSTLRTGSDGLTLGGNSARVVWMNRHTTADTAGNQLTIQSGGATSSATDKDAGILYLQSGTSTGTGTGQVKIQTPTPGSTGTSDNSLADRVTIDSTGVVVTGKTTTDTFKLTTSPTNNYVLTSDGSGNGTWQAASGGTGITRSIVSITSSTTLGATALTDYVALVGASGAPTMPTAVGNTNRYTIKNVHSTNKTVAFTGAETGDGSSTLTLTPNTSVDLISDNTNWRII